jgi:hypothetical protein
LSLIEINWNPDKKELRKFGLIALFVLGAAACVSRFVFLAPALASIIVASVGLLIFIVTLISVKAARAIYLGMTFAALPIGLVVSVVLMAIFYFLILTPIGLFFKIIGRDLLQRKFEPDSQTYWCKKQNNDDPERYFHQF